MRGEGIYPQDGPIRRGERASTRRADQSDEGRGHLPEYLVRLFVLLQLDGQLGPRLRQLAQLLLVDDDGAVADWVDLALGG
eukprot:7688703-Pyramimonas_sp.AAC.1